MQIGIGKDHIEIIFVFAVVVNHLSVGSINQIESLVGIKNNTYLDSAAGCGLENVIRTILRKVSTCLSLCAVDSASFAGSSLVFGVVLSVQRDGAKLLLVAIVGGNSDGLTESIEITTFGNLGCTNFPSLHVVAKGKLGAGGGDRLAVLIGGAVIEQSHFLSACCHSHCGHGNKSKKFLHTL